MIMQWLFFIISAVVTYVGISILGQIGGGGSATPLAALLSVLRPAPFAVMVVSNLFFGLSIYYGFTITRFAIPMTIATGALTGFVFSVVVLGAKVTMIKVAGILCVIAGIAMLSL